MDYQVSKINKSDGRSFWHKCYQCGKDAFKRGVGLIGCPKSLSANGQREWKAGWHDACEKKNKDEELFYVDYE